MDCLIIDKLVQFPLDVLVNGQVHKITFQKRKSFLFLLIVLLSIWFFNCNLTLTNDLYHLYFAHVQLCLRNIIGENIIMGLKFNVLLHRLPTQKGILLPKHDLINQIMRPKDHFGGKFVLDFWVKQLSIHGSFLFVTFNVIFVLISCKFFHCLFILFLHKLTYRFWIKRWNFVFHFLF